MKGQTEFTALSILEPNEFHGEFDCQVNEEGYIVSAVEDIEQQDAGKSRPVKTFVFYFFNVVLLKVQTRADQR